MTLQATSNKTDVDIHRKSPSSHHADKPVKDSRGYGKLCVIAAWTIALLSWPVLISIGMLFEREPIASSWIPWWLSLRDQLSSLGYDIFYYGVPVATAITGAWLTFLDANRASGHNIDRVVKGTLLTIQCVVLALGAVYFFGYFL